MAGRRAAAGSPAAARRPAGALEAEVLAVLEAAGRPLTAGQVRQRLADRQRASCPTARW